MKNILRILRSAGLAASVLSFLTGAAFAQTALTTTTLSAAVANTTDKIVQVASNTGIAVDGLLIIDKEAMEVDAIDGTNITVRRGHESTRSTSHVTASTVYVGAKGRFYNDYPSGSCTRGDQEFLPHISLNSAGIRIYDCPVGTNSNWVELSDWLQSYTVRSEAFNLDNGAGTTIDAVLIRHPRRIHISACRIVYEDATTGTVAAGTASVGTTVGGGEIVAATAYANATAVGGTTAMVIVNGNVAAGTPVLVRHTGVGAAQAGEAVVECEYSPH